MPEDMRITLSAGFPGEALVVAILNYATEVRKTMSQANIDRLDAVNLRFLEAVVSVWPKP